MLSLIVAVALTAQPPAPNPAAVDARTAREQAIYKEWAKAVRESVETAERLKGKSKNKPAERRAKAMRAAQAKEDKILKKYKLAAYRLSPILRRGVEEQWPTDRPGDIDVISPIVAERRARLDAIAYEADMQEFIAAYMRAPRAYLDSRIYLHSLELAKIYSTRIPDELRRIAPIRPCGANLPGGKTCDRKVVGDIKRPCYEHR